MPSRFRRLAAPGLAAAGLALAGCATPPAHPPAVAGAGRPCEIVLAGHTEAAAADDKPGVLPPPNPEQAHAAGRLLPISLDTVLRLAEDGNAQIAAAREKVNESLAEQELADKSWIPQVSAEVGYYRHEGGVQNEDGTLTHSSTGAFFPGVEIRSGVDLREAIYNRVDAERKVWQSRGELSRVCNDTLLEAVNTYFDLLAARHGEALSERLQGYEEKLLKRAESLVQPDDKSAQVVVEAVRAEMDGRREARLRLHQQGDAAGYKLAYLLGLPPDACLVPADPAPVLLDLVKDAGLPTPELVTRAITYGPGVQELQSMLNVIQAGMARLEGPVAFLPTVQVALSEGLVGYGPGASMAFDNRFDGAVQLRWDLTAFLTAHEKKRAADSRMMQVRYNLDDLRGRLTLGVREAQQAILSGRPAEAHAAAMIEHARKSYELSDLRLKENVMGATIGDVQQALRGLETAEMTRLNAVTAHNKAEARLLLLLGHGADNAPPAGAACPAPAGK